MKSRMININALFTVTLFSLVFNSSVLLSQDKGNGSLTAESGYINVDSGKLFYEIAGSGEFIVLLHDGVVHREIWDGQFPVLAKNYRVVRYDRRSYGNSSAADSLYSDIKDLNQLFEQLHIKRAVVFGISSGGGLAIDFALAYPEKVSGLVLVGAVVSGYGYSSHMMTRGGHVNSLSELLGDSRKTIKYLAWDDPYEIYYKNRAAKEKFAKLLQTNMINVDREKHGYSIPPDRPASRFLSEIKVPVLVMVGEYDIPDVHSHAGVIEYGIPGAKREIIMNCGHLIPLEQPEAFNDSVIRFLKGMEFINILNSEGIKAAAEYFHNKRNSDPDIVLFDEAQMNLLGYGSLSEGKIKEAIELFKLNVIAYPDSWNVYDSLAEAYLKNGETESAVANYKKSLELNPNNTNARKILKTLTNND